MVDLRNHGGYNLLWDLLEPWIPFDTFDFDFVASTRLASSCAFWR